jgi:hypothetical protein
MRARLQSDMAATGSSGVVVMHIRVLGASIDERGPCARRLDKTIESLTRPSKMYNLQSGVSRLTLPAILSKSGLRCNNIFCSVETERDLVEWRRCLAASDLVP